MKIEHGKAVTFKTTGYEVADIRNPNPPPTAIGVVNGDPSDSHVPVWCEREGREATTIMVARSNIIDVFDAHDLHMYREGQE